MESPQILGLTGVLCAGVGAQLLAWRLRVPSILVLLLSGLALGPFLGVVNPDLLFGSLLSPLISLSVAIILFEGGLSLRFSEIPGLQRVVLSLISLGAFVAWVVAAVAAVLLLSMPIPLAILLGAILTVSGPTVIIPLLRDVRPRAPLGSILKWEGILIDPVGALLAVLVFEAIGGGPHGDQPLLQGLLGIGETLLFGGGIGIIAAGVVLVFFSRYWIPDYLQSPFVLALVLGAFVIANQFHREAGLLTVTLMGVILANRPQLQVRHILEFKENLRTLLIAVLFILLAARLPTENLKNLGVESVLFLGVIIFVARPLAVFLSTAHSQLSTREKLFLSAVAPRGIVAAAVSSVFSLELARAGYPGADLIVLYTFLTIIGTVSFYGLTSGFAARLLGVQQRSPQGALIVGADLLGRQLAEELKKAGFRVQLIDTNPANVYNAKRMGLYATCADALSESIFQEVDLDGIGRLFALTPNNEANSLTALHFQEAFGRAEVFQLAPTLTSGTQEAQEQPLHLRGRFLFGEKYTHTALGELFRQGGSFVSIKLTQERTLENLQSQYTEGLVPLFLVTAEGRLEVFASEAFPTSKPGHQLIALVTSEVRGRLEKE